MQTTELNSHNSSGDSADADSAPGRSSTDPPPDTEPLATSRLTGGQTPFPDLMPEDEDDGELQLSLYVAESLPPSLTNRIDSDWLRDKTLALLEHLDQQRGEISIVLTDDELMAEKHQQHLGVSGTTDVLTFDLRSIPDQSDDLDVEILVCVDEADRRSREFGHELRRELLLYILHGLLHCLGYDDTNEENYLRMHAREDELLRAIGVGETFRSLDTGEESNAATDEENL